jgi:hypothetical protein
MIRSAQNIAPKCIKRVVLIVLQVPGVLYGHGQDPIFCASRVKFLVQLPTAMFVFFNIIRQIIRAKTATRTKQI